MANAPYTIEEDFDATTFTVTPEPFNIGGSWRLPFQAVFSAVMLTGCGAISVASGGAGVLIFLFGVAFWGGLYWLAHRNLTGQFNAHKAERQQVRIHAADGELIAGDLPTPTARIPYKNLHRLVVRNSQDGQYVGGSTGGFVATGGTGVAGAASMAVTGALAGAANMAARAAAAKHAKYTQVCYQLFAEASGVSYVLAQGMTEAGANGLMQDLAKAISERNR